MTYGYLCTDTQLLVLTQLTRSRLADYATRMLWRSANASPCVGRMYQTDKWRLSSMLLFERCLTTKWKSRWNALKALCQWKSASGRVSPVSSASHRRYFSGGFRRGNQVTARERKRQRNRRTEAVNTDEQFLFISENQLQITGLSFFCITEHKRLQNDALSGFFCLLFVKKMRQNLIQNGSQFGF